MNIIQRPTGKHGPDPSKPYYLILHDTEGSFPSDLNWLLDPDAKVSVQYVIAPDGTIYQTVQDTQRAWHAGESSWAGFSDMNSYSIGIEISHVSAGTKPYPPAQLQALDELIWMLHQKHHFRGSRPIGHREVAPRRKSDPELNLENYTWEKVQARLNKEEDMTEQEVIAIIKKQMDIVSAPEQITAAQAKLVEMGLISRAHPAGDIVSVGLLMLLIARLADKGIDLSEYELVKKA